jgi:hypothetical protein
VPTKSPEANQRYCRSYYERVKADPVKYAALLARNRRNRQQTSPSKTSDSQVASRTCESDSQVDSQVAPGSEITRPLGGKHSAPVTQGDCSMGSAGIIKAWHRQWR